MVTRVSDITPTAAQKLPLTCEMLPGQFEWLEIRAISLRFGRRHRAGNFIKGRAAERVAPGDRGSSDAEQKEEKARAGGLFTQP